VASIPQTYRRSSGVYVVRSVVPPDLREHLAGKRELHISTGTRNFGEAKIRAAEIRAELGRKFIALRRLGNMDLRQVMLGSPVLAGGGLLALVEAASVSGFTPEELLRKASAKLLRLYLRVVRSQGHLIPVAQMEEDEPGTGRLVVPSSDSMPVGARPEVWSGVLAVRHSQQVAQSLLSAGSVEALLFNVPGEAAWTFAPDLPVRIEVAALEVEVTEVEALRRLAATAISPAHLQAITCATPSNEPPAGPVPSSLLPHRLLSTFVDEYMRTRAADCKEDQARRIRGAIEVCISLLGDPPLRLASRALLKRLRDVELPKFPADLHLLFPGGGAAGMAAHDVIAQADLRPSWPRLSEREREKRFGWFCGFVTWLYRDGHLSSDPADGLEKRVLAVKAGSRKVKAAAHTRRDDFTDEELAQIFGAAWFKDGKGELTAVGTYRTFLPVYYWLPLIGLYTGARINEICQLRLDDIRQTSTGVWFFDITDEAEDQSVKTANSRRNVPIHASLMDLGLLDWVGALRAAGHERLFPELTYDAIKGYSKAAVKWFSRYLGGFGWPRDGRKTFHSFRHTFLSRAINDFGLDPNAVAQVTGHQRSMASGMRSYAKNVVPEASLPVIQAIQFALPAIAAFDTEAGLQAIRDGMRRKATNRAGGRPTR